MPSRIVKSTVRYLGPCVGKPIFYGLRRHLDNLPLEAREVSIEDVRSSKGAISLDCEGFALFPHRTIVRDFLDPDIPRDTYIRESAEFLRQITNAIKVIPTTNVIRRSERSERFRMDRTTVPGRFVHCDYSPNSAGSSFWVEKLLSQEEAKDRLARRFAIYNMWRVLSDPPQDTPLAICDFRSLGPDDCVGTECVEELPEDPELRFELSTFRHNPNHRWCYFSDMTRDEILIFKGFDSDSERANGVPHVAFDDPSCPEDAPARESIDARFVVFFDD